MAKLTTGARQALPAKTFAGPNRSFPIPDKSHAVAAIQDAAKAVKAGSITPAQKTTIVAKAKSKLDNFGPKAAKPFGGRSSDPHQMPGHRGHMSYKG